jgi:cysteine synthase
MSVLTTPVRTFDKRFYIKLEYLQTGGSHKARAAKRVIAAAELAGHLQPDGRHLILEKSGGNFGIGLATHGIPAGYPVKLLVRPSFSGFRRHLLARLGVELIGQEEMKLGATNQQVIDLYLGKYRREGLIPFFSDQFNNEACIEAHKDGAREYTRQLLDAGVSTHEAVTLVKCVGSGASLRAYGEVFAETFPNLKVVVVQPEGCDFSSGTFTSHPFEGASVGLIPPFLPVARVDEFIAVEHEAALDTTLELFSKTGVFAGKTTGLAVAGATQIACRTEGPIAMIAYDAGDAYAADNYHGEGDRNA